MRPFLLEPPARRPPSEEGPTGNDLKTLVLKWKSHVRIPGNAAFVNPVSLSSGPGMRRTVVSPLSFVFLFLISVFLSLISHFSLNFFLKFPYFFLLFL